MSRCIFQLKMAIGNMINCAWIIAIIAYNMGMGSGKVKINLAKSAGFCFGVKRAIQLAKKSTDSGYQIEMLGPIVHNEEVTKDIENLGVKTVRQLKKGKKKALLVRAHGAPLKILERAD